MGYTTDFSGRFETNKPLSDKMFNYLKMFSETRRMARNMDAAYGVEGEFFVEGKGFTGQGDDSTVIDHNKPASTQPGLWCQWTPSDDRMGIEWDCGEKFYNYTEWIVYLIHKILAPNGYVLNGAVKWQGEDVGDVGKIIVEDNRVFTEPWEGSMEEHTPQNVETYCYPKNKVAYMQTETVLIVDSIEQPLLEEPKKELEAPKEDNMAKKFGYWLILHTDEVDSVGVCRRYKRKVYNINELYDIFIGL